MSGLLALAEHRPMSGREFLASMVAGIEAECRMHRSPCARLQRCERDEPTIVALRDRVTATADAALKEDQVRATIVLKDGRRLEKFIEHVVGSVERPLTDTDLENNSEASLRACSRIAKPER